jgi:hypothetical protein
MTARVLGLWPWQKKSESGQIASSDCCINEPFAACCVEASSQPSAAQPKPYTLTKGVTPPMA